MKWIALWTASFFVSLAVGKLFYRTWPRFKASLRTFPDMTPLYAFELLIRGDFAQLGRMTREAFRFIGFVVTCWLLIALVFRSMQTFSR